ncbi:hypothetical protein PG994_006676 [Apiospora phragmitis]|uniref:Glycosyltransferase family 32 protein n=1 Tax=Apiospora phragmitis TaxID=2905665 RepID=A0ABR1VFQ5_9PEZI
MAAASLHLPLVEAWRSPLRHNDTSSTPTAAHDSNNNSFSNNNNHNERNITQETIPKKLWFKLGPRGLNHDTRRWTETCIQQNPEYEPHYLTDAEADAFVNARFAADRPDIVDVYNALTVPILKADTLRYLLLYAEGGVWFDTDASCEGIPIDDGAFGNTTTPEIWQLRENRARAGLIVGWEFDVGLHYEFQRQFVTWAVAARAGSRHLLAVVDDIVASIRETAEEQNLTVAQLSMQTIPDVVHFTGPYHELLAPALVEDVLILPGYALAASMNTYEAADWDRVGPSLVVHHYAGSWKNEFGGEWGR